MIDFSRIFKDAVKQYSSQIALQSGEERISYEELDVRVKEQQQVIQALGIQPGDCIAVAAPNNIEYCILLFTLWRMRVITCLFNPKIPLEQIRQQAVGLGCRYCFNKINGCPSPLTRVTPVRQHRGGSHEPQNTATILFTSGSSGKPKAVVHSIANHYYSAKGSNENIPVQPPDSWLLSLPIYHVSGLSILFRCLLGGATIILPEKDEKLQDAIIHYNPTHLSLVTTQLYRLLKHGVRGITKAILLGGGAIPKSLLSEAAQNDLPVYITYGLTEMASQVATANTPGALNAKVLNHRQIKISDDGEILVKGETLFEGYWSEGAISRPVEEDGWFATGDVGTLDEQGCLTVTGRKDNMFISGGENIYPEEIEKQLLNMHFIHNAVVVPVKDVEFGCRPVAFLDVHTARDFNPEEIINQLRKVLPGFKIPREYYPWPDNIPSAGIKINRQFFIQLAQDNTSKRRGG